MTEARKHLPTRQGFQEGTRVRSYSPTLLSWIRVCSIVGLHKKTCPIQSKCVKCVQIIWVQQKPTNTVMFSIPTIIC